MKINLGSEIPTALQTNSIFQGSYPELVMRDFRRLIQLLAANISQTLDMSIYAREIGVFFQQLNAGYLF